MDPFGLYYSHFALYKEVVLSLEVEMYWYNREGTSKCVLYREVFSFIQSVLYQKFYCTKIYFLQYFMHVAHMLDTARCSCASHL